MSATDNAAPITAPASAGDSIDDTPSATAAAGESQLRITASDIFNLLWTKLGYYTQWYLQPLLLLAFLALPIWLVDYEISWFLIKPRHSGSPGHFGSKANADRDFWFGVTFMIISILLQVLRFGSFLWLFIQGHVVARMMRPQFPEAPSVLQCADSTGIRRWCKICEIFQDNRVYHCSAVGLCLPVHDHTCRWWGGRIWAANFKANLNFLFWTEIHLLFLSGVGIFAWTQGRIVVRLYAAGILFVPLLICVRLGYIFFTNFWEVVSTNLLWKESNRENIFFTMNTSGRWNDVYRWDVAKLETNPWDLGRVENRRQFFGARRSWLFFWTPTPIMKNGPVFNNRVNPARPIGGEDRTRAIACSGAEETEQETLASMDVIQRR